MEEQKSELRRVCVTGAGGFIASWLVKLLLSKGYKVHGTVRDPSNEKNDHLKKLNNATKNLQLFKADLLSYNAIVAAFSDCEGVFHVASPIILKGISNPENWYYLSKTMAEREAFKYAKENGLDVITVCPSLTLGPFLQSNINLSSLMLLDFLKGSHEFIETYRCGTFVDVRDNANALLLVYENPDAFGRYVCSLNLIQFADLIDMLKNIYPSFNYPKNIFEMNEANDLSSEKLKKIGWKCRTLKETIANSVKYYQEVGLLTKE